MFQVKRKVWRVWCFKLSGNMLDVDAHGVAAYNAPEQSQKTEWPMGSARGLCGFALVMMMCGASAAPAAQSASVTSDDWTIVADPVQSTLTIKTRALGVVLQNIRLHVGRSDRHRQLKQWQVDANEKELTVRTTDPATAWSFQPQGTSLRISSTEYDAFLTAEAPTTPSRMVARLIDSEGAPVDWVGTGEVAHTYGGSFTHNRSFLPRRNPDVMYFSLGQAQGSLFHSLFDRDTDIAIDFGEGVTMARDSQNENLLSLNVPVPGNRLLRFTPDYYTKVLGVPFYSRFDDSYFRAAPMVWSSWTSYYEAVTERDVTLNTDWIAAHLLPYGFEYVELDDGYDRTPEGHSWIENWDKTKFPHGPEWLTNYIRLRGLRAGIWLVPNAYAAGLPSHPDWYVYDKRGNVVRDYDTPALDSTHPEALAVVTRIIRTLDEWGFDYFKFDGEHALPKYAPVVDTTRLKNARADFIANYRERVAMIRQTMGPKRFIEACPAGTPLNAIGYANSYFNGDDVYNNWQGMYSLFSSIYANGFLNHLLVYVMPGEGLELGEPMTVEEAASKRKPVVIETERDREEPVTGFGVTDAEARTLVSHVALTGVAYPLASVMPELPEARVRLLQATMPTLPIIPLDLFSRGTKTSWDKFKHVQPDTYIHDYPEILDLKVDAPAGTYDVAGITNWRSGTASRSIDFSEKLGLDRDSKYVVFDFWNQKLLGVFSGHADITVDSHDTRVLLIHPLLNRPQLIGLSRHISGAYSILSQSWDSSRSKLEGQSATVPGAPYSLWFYVPDGLSATQFAARNDRGQTLPVQKNLAGNALQLTFTGQQNPVDWQIQFARK